MSVTVQTIPQEPRRETPPEVSEFFVPTVLGFNLKKTKEDRKTSVEIVKRDTFQDGNITTEEDEDVTEMSSRKKESSVNGGKQTSSFLLTSFRNPAKTYAELNAENPVLKALLGNKIQASNVPWSYVARTSINNCHPFKKTSLSCDPSTDNSPVQLPKSLTKKSSKTRRNQKTDLVTEKTAPGEPNGSKDAKLPSDPQNVQHESSSLQQEAQPQSLEKNSGHLSIFNRKAKVMSQPTLPSNKPRSQYVNSERLIQLKAMVDDAIRKHKVYSMTGCYNSVRNALKQRGWIEKIDSDIKTRRRICKLETNPIYDAAFQFVEKNHTIVAMRLAVQTNSGFIRNDQIHYTDQGEAEIVNRMLKNVTEDLCWLSRPYPYYCWKEFDKFEMINRFPRAYFSNKVGLCNSLKQLPWFYEAGVCSTQFPRTFNVSMKEEIEAFKEDYRLTAAIGTLKWFMQTYKTGGEKAVWSPDGKVEPTVIEFSLRRCAEYIRSKQHEDIDIPNTPTLWDYQWEQFITQYYKIVNEGQILKETKNGIKIEAIAANVQSMLNILKPYWPQYDIDGYQNYWIVKPGGRCCGAGIVIKNNLEQILLLVNPDSMKESRYVVQKYIERPLLIYNTKFDIRQWFLVTSVYPLTVWMYKECYLRFCSQPFTLKNTHESIHLCNNAVQRRYKNGKRDRGLPDENMWDCYTFQTYLKATGHPDVWEKIIYPGMKEGFVGALLASQDTMERRKNCFELYGADFMISENLTDGPWLIEINSNPAMESSTSVTARMCPQVLEDIIKVVIDRRNNKSAPTGAFEMVFKQSSPPIPPYFGMSLFVKGKKAYRSSGDYRITNRKTGILPKDSLSSHRGGSSLDEGSSGGSYSRSSHSPLKETPNGAKNVTAVKRRKVDWVRKNIDSVKSVTSLKHPSKSESNEALQSSPKKQVTDSEIELKYRFYQEVKQFLEDSKKASSEKTKGEETELIADESKEGHVKEDTRRKFAKVPNAFQQEDDEEEVLWDCVFEDVSKSPVQLPLTTSSKSCPSFDTVFEDELRKVENKVGKKTGKPGKQVDLFFSATSLSCPNNNKTSLDYFQDWKSKLSETRRTCEDMLTKLQVFQEENSKVKFQNALKKRLKDEVEFIKRIRQIKKSKILGRGKEGSKGEQKEVKQGDSRQKTWECEDSELTPLAINSETGAVRSINGSLPKFKQRSRPVLPNGSSGLGRKDEKSQGSETQIVEILVSAE